MDAPAKNQLDLLTPSDHALPHDQESLRQLLEGLHEGIYFLDRDRKITYWNRAAERISGYERELVLGRSCAANILVHTDEEGKLLCKGRCPAYASILDGQTRGAVVYLRHRDGHRVPVNVRIQPLFDEDGAVLGVYEIFQEATVEGDRDARLAELERLAMYDQLTEMPNRRYLESRLRARHDDFIRHGWPFAVLFADIDKFKSVNDNHGHDVGDLVLQTVAHTLSHGVRNGDIIGRWGGEEFLAVLSNIDQAGLEAVSHRLCALVRASTTKTECCTLVTTVSLGGVLIREGESIDDVVKRADRALYEAKETGRDRFVLAPG